MPTWPSTLPAPRVSGYSLESGDATVRTDMESGPARVRRRYTAAPDTLQLRWLFSDTQMDTFRDTWDGDWAHGSAWINLPVRDGRTGGVVNHEARPNPAKFTAELVSANVWTVSMTVEIRHA